MSEPKPIVTRRLDPEEKKRLRALRRALQRKTEPQMTDLTDRIAQVIARELQSIQPFEERLENLIAAAIVAELGLRKEDNGRPGISRHIRYVTEWTPDE